MAQSLYNRRKIMTNFIGVNANDKFQFTFFDPGQSRKWEATVIRVKTEEDTVEDGVADVKVFWRIEVPNRNSQSEVWISDEDMHKIKEEVSSYDSVYGYVDENDKFVFCTRPANEESNLNSKDNEGN